MVACSSLFTFGLLAMVQLVAGHGAIIKATGNAGGSGTALGINAATPRDGTKRNPFQQDTTRFKGDAAETFGETLGAGDNNPETGTQAVLAANGGTLPQITPGGQVEMTLHQVNTDGAGPYTCMINADGTGTTWQPMTVTQQVPGEKGRNRDGQTTDFPLTAAVPAGQTCTGDVAGQANVCMVRCENPARAGPFGGVVPVQLAAGGAAADNATTTTAAANNAAAVATSSSTTSSTSRVAAAAATPNAGTSNAQATADDAATEAEEEKEDEAKKRRRRRVSPVERRAAITYRTVGKREGVKK